MFHVIYKVTGQNKIFKLTQLIWFRAKEAYVNKIFI